MNADGPVYFSNKRMLEHLPGMKMVGVGLLYRAVKEGETLPERDFWQEYTWHTLDPQDARGDYTAEAILADYHFARGRDYLAAGAAEDGIAEFKRALGIGGENKESLNNVASACAEYGQMDVAERYFLRALELDPEYRLALVNVGKLCMQQGQYERALARFRQYLEESAGNPEVNWLTIECLKRLGRVNDALGRLEMLAEVAPSDERVWREMGLLYLNEKGDFDTARHMFARSIELNPDQPELSMIVARPQDAAAFRPDMPGVSPQLPGSVPALPDIMPSLPQAPVPQLPFIPEP